jgi:hypothetical protein
MIHKKKIIRISLILDIMLLVINEYPITLLTINLS